MSSSMDADQELDCDLSVYDADDSDLREYVVLRGYEPGCTSKSVTRARYTIVHL